MDWCRCDFARGQAVCGRLNISRRSRGHAALVVPPKKTIKFIISRGEKRARCILLTWQSGKYWELCPIILLNSA